MRWQPALDEKDFQAIDSAFAFLSAELAHLDDVHDEIEQADQTFAKLRRSYWFAYGAEGRKVGDARRAKEAL